MARKNEKQNKEIIGEAGEKDAQKAEKKIIINVKFKTTYIGTLGNFYSGKEYDLTPEQFDLFSNEVEVL